MHAETHHHLRAFFLAVLLALLALMMLAKPAHSAWGSEPVLVHATTAACPLVAASDDARFGAIFTWQENTGAGGVLRAQHVLANGDVDPSWGAGVDVCSAEVRRAALGSVSDGTGGAYVWWMENAALYVTRVAPSGALAGGWPVRGRNLGTLYSNRQRPSVVSDGSGGLYVAWLAGSLTEPWMSVARAIHLGPANTGKGGWPNAPRVLGTTPDAVELVDALGIDAAPDGGLWVAFATTTVNAPVFEPGDVRLVRCTSAGLLATGWNAHGVSLAPFRGDLLVSDAWRIVPGMNLVAVANDGATGAFVSHGDPDDSAVPSYRLSRVTGDGSTAPGWASEGLALTPWGYSPDYDAGANASMRSLADGRGGVFAGVPGFGSESTSIMAFEHFSSSGSSQSGGVTTDQLGLECASRGDGGLFVTSFYPSGPNGPFSPIAYVLVKQSDPGASFFEYHDTPVTTWYGDVALAATGDGGAIFGWSQVNQRFGIFAVRLGPAGLVTSVPPATVKGPPMLRLRFVPGVGVRALLSAVPACREELTLHDAAGRLMASVRIEDAGGGDWVYPGTEALPSGLYFARAVAGGVVLHARVAVLR